MKNKIDKKVIRIRAALVFLTMFVIILGCTFLVNENQKKREQLKAAYTAESTISRVEVQLNRYMAESDLVKKSIEDGLMISDAQFAQLSRLMQDEDYIIKTHEIAKDGIVSQIYPIQGNENAMGFNVLEDSERKKAALLARDSGEYTIAGPFDLVQGGTGVLLFDPVYQTDAQGNEKFWGFSILLWTGKSSSTRWNWINLKKPDIIIKSGKEAIRMTSRLLLHSAQILKRMIHWKLPVKFRMIHGILKSFRETDGLLQCRSYGDC